MKQRRWQVIAALVVAIAGCGGRVVVDRLGGDGEGGGGGGPSTGTNGGNGMGGGNVCSETPSPTMLANCSGAATTGSGVTRCEFAVCDQDNNVYGATCDETTCTCSLNGFVGCSCALEQAGNICAGTPNCCPWFAEAP